MSEVRVNKLSPRSGTTVTLGDSGDTITIPSGVTFDASSGGLAGTLTTAAQPNITSVGTLTSFTSTGIDDNATSTAITISSSENVGIGTSSPNNQLEIKSDTSTVVTRLACNSGTGRDWGVASATDGAFGIYDYDAAAYRMRINSSGNVGIGTNSPTDTNGFGKALDIQGSTGGAIYVGSSGDRGIFGYASGEQHIINPSASGTTRFTINGSERMRIDSSGNVGIGTTSPSEKLEVNGNVKMGAVSGSTFTVRVTPAAGVWGIDAGTDASSFSRIRISSSGTGTQTKMAFFNTNGEVGSITTSGTSTAFNTSSDYRLKENVNYDFDATTRLKQLRPARFNFIADADTTVDGFIAHEVSSVVPEAITGEKDAVDEDGNPKYQGIDQSKLVPLLVKTIQELEARITALETQP
jgi:hypothetical protein